MRRLLILPLLATSLFYQGGGQPFSIAIQPTDWKLGAGTVLTTLPDGTKVVQAGYGSSFSVDLGITPVQVQKLPDGTYAKGIYTLSFLTVNGEPGYPGYFRWEIDFGTQELCDSGGWGMGAFLWNGVYGSFYRESFTCHSPAYIVADQALPGGGLVQGNKNLILTVTVNDGSFNGGWPLVFKDAMLSFTPVN